jgi:uncharacterized protein YukE
MHALGTRSCRSSKENVKMEKERNIRNRWVNLRMTSQEFNQLEYNRKKTTERTNSEYIRKLALNLPITVRTRNASLDDFTEEMIQLRKQLSAIGHNVNQAVRKLHTLKMIPEFRQWIQNYEHTHQQIHATLNTLSSTIEKNNSQW